MTTNIGSLAPTVTSTAYGEAYIAVNNNRIKTYDSTIYLQDGQEFQIELFNPSTTTKLATISINGKAISTAGIVLKPGVRVFLDRFIDKATKFLFETYIVEDTPTTKAAIATNGDVQINFYDEVIPEPKRKYLEPSPWEYNQTLYRNTSIGHSSNTYGGQHVNSLSSSKRSTAGGQGGDSAYFMSQNSIETGRVEQGGNSNQRFTKYNGKFNTYITNSVHIKLLPISAKPIELKDLATYCTACGTKNRRGTYKYCPKCGGKF